MLFILKIELSDNTLIFKWANEENIFISVTFLQFSIVRKIK